MTKIMRKKCKDIFNKSIEISKLGNLSHNDVLSMMVMTFI